MSHFFTNFVSYFQSLPFMLFNSLQFLLFFPLVVGIYFCIPSLRVRNLFLLLASYFFYMCWNPTYALLLLGSTSVTYFAALAIEKLPKHRKIWITLGIVSNVLILVFFKYWNWLAESITHGLASAGIDWKIEGLDLLLPVGISFYIFQALGYSIDVYQKKIKAEKDFWTYALFVSFFPQLVAGPIERSTNLLPQFKEKKEFVSENIARGLNFMLWGFFLKLVIADRCATYVDAIFNNPTQHNGGSFLLASILFTFQIYGDFGGYSLIAIGVAKCMGFKLMQNFNRPYLSTSVKEFWRRWHISLSTWFSDYVYKPLGGSRCSIKKHQRNLLITFGVSGLWHGANLTFIVWGLYHGILLAVNATKRRLMKARYNRETIFRPGKVINFFNILITFALSVAGWIIFRANTMSDALLAFKKIGTEMGAPFPGLVKGQWLILIAALAILVIKEIWQERGREWDKIKLSPVTGGSFALAMVFIILMCGVLDGGQFIYFQF